MAAHATWLQKRFFLPFHVFKQAVFTHKSPAVISFLQFPISVIEYYAKSGSGNDSIFKDGYI